MSLALRVHFDFNPNPPSVPMKRSILSINGNKPFNYILKTVLSERHSVTVASDPISGLRFMKTSADVDLIIIDMDLHQDEAFDFIRYIKTSLIYSKPVVMLSSADAEEVVPELDGFEIHQFFKKPFSPVDLVQAVDSILAQKNENITVKP
jgi:CheY-like chemotaxis protein